MSAVACPMDATCPTKLLRLAAFGSLGRRGVVPASRPRRALLQMVRPGGEPHA